MVLSCFFFVLSFVILLLTHGQATFRQEIIQRLNYGVVVREQKTIRIVADEWTHAFTTPLLDPELYVLDKPSEATLDFNCSLYSLSSRVASCNSFKPLLMALSSLHDISLRRRRSIIAHMYEILPANYVDRGTRGLFDLGGQILNSLFGVVTTKQLNAIRSTALHITSENAKAFESWQKHSDQLSSFMTLANHRLDNLARVTQTQHDVVAELTLNTDFITHLRLG